jgi:hypothetical protein
MPINATGEQWKSNEQNFTLARVTRVLYALCALTAGSCGAPNAPAQHAPGRNAATQNAAAQHASSPPPRGSELAEPSEHSEQHAALAALDAAPTVDGEVLWEDKSAPKPKMQPAARRQVVMQRLNQAEAPQASAVPTTCAAPGAACFPPASFVERLCRSTHPSVALFMFQSASPWQRAYVAFETKAWTTSPHGSESDRLLAGEEVLLLQSDLDPNATGLQTSAAASYAALRWDGSCVKLTQEELQSELPLVRRIAHIEWNWLDDNLQTALRADAAIDDAVQSRRKVCKGARTGNLSKPCQIATERLVKLVEAYVRSGKGIPEPTTLP